MSNLLYSVFDQVQKKKDQGQTLIELNVGQPDQKPPITLTQSLKKALDQNQLTYISSSGHKDLITILAQKHQTNPQNILIGPGSKFIIYALLKHLIKNQKRQIVIIQPCWPTYPLIIKDLHGKIISINTTLKDSWQPKLKDIKKVLAKKNVALIINNPNNPTSTLINNKLMHQICQIAKKNNTIIIHDHAYKDLTFNPIKTIPLYQNHVHIFSISKNLAAPGLRLGYIIADPKIISNLKSFLQLTITCLPPFIQSAVATTLKSSSSTIYANKIRSIYQQRANIAVKILKNSPCSFTPPQAGFYLFLNTHQNGKKLSLQLLKKGIAVIPGTAFGPYPTFIRLSLTQSKEKITKALKTIVKLSKN